MSHFFIAFSAVLQMLLFVAIAFLLVRFKKFNESSISVFVTLLLYVSQPCLTAYSFQKATILVRDGVIMREQMLLCGLWVFALSLVLQAVFLALAYFVLRKKQQQVQYRIFVIATMLCNSGFFGVPVLEAVMGKEHPEVAMFSALFSFVMNMLCWTVVSTIITRDKKYISFQKIFLNPNTVAAIVTIVMLCGGWVLPDQLYGMVELLGRFSTPLCMFILGMRLAMVKPRELFLNWKQYGTVLVKNIGFPLFSFAALYFVPVDVYLKQTLFIICCCPTASMTLSFAEMLGQGQKTAANLVSLSTISCLITLPMMCLLLPYFS